jgi:hypothetical protein
MILCEPEILIDYTCYVILKKKKKKKKENTCLLLGLGCIIRLINTRVRIDQVDGELLQWVLRPWRRGIVADELDGWGATSDGTDITFKWATLP